ncbi:MAG: ATPase [Lachnospiraceae bacterium]|uniref:V-type ATP synthase subunit I n=1 Tax=Candidatus Merdisoma sp. JLR.KK006 TaxID=3112626 RepID=UPI002FF24A63|nr:ATPase [Lachnospiraceae bacterium]
MIVKMNFLSITGPKDDIERMAEQYLSKYEIQLENALTELKTVQNLRPYTDKNPYDEVLKQAKEYLPQDLKTSRTFPDMTVTEAIDLLKKAEKELEDLQEKKAKLLEKKEKCRDSQNKIVPFQEIPYDIHELLGFHHVKYRFGRISREYFEKFERYVYDTLDTIFYKCQCDDSYVWGVYFVPASFAEKIDAVYASMHFEHFFMPDEYVGTPKDALKKLKEGLESLDKELAAVEQEMNRVVADHGDQLAAACDLLEYRRETFEIRKYAAITKEKNQVFYILCGWMPEEQADAFQAEIEQDEKIFVVVEDDHDNVFSSPPTKLKNPKLFRPFEMYIKMYGLPAYNEMDPTIFVALTYSFIFGAMFGDVGQGLVLLIGGAVLYKLKGMDLAAIVSCAGIFSTLFGFMYGSFFGFEDTVIHHIWLSPKEAMMTLPIIGQMNTVFVVAVVFGMFMILTAMVLHIRVSIRNKDAEGWFDQNGVAGFIFYGALAVVLFMVMSGHVLPAGIVLGVVFGIPLLAMFFKEPLTAMLEKKGKGIEGGVGMYLVQSFFEMFEVLLSFFSNTLSFVRVGAFAVSHAAMMEVVLMLAGFEGGSGNWLVIILGNIFVCAMEGLIVGIQVLRLQYYELFSRYYKGTGQEFVPYKMKKAKEA